MRGLLALISVSLIMCGCVATGRYSGRFAEGKQYYENGKYFEAAVSFYNALKEDPEGKFAEDALFLLAESYRRMGADNEAAAVYQTYLTKYPDGKYAIDARKYLVSIQEMAMAERNQLEQAQKIYAEMERKLKQDIEEDPKNPAPYLRLGDFYWRNGDIEAAYEYYTKAIQLNPELLKDRILKQRSQELKAELDKMRHDEVLSKLRVRNQHLYSLTINWLVATGEIWNEGDFIARRVMLDVVLYDFGGNVLDSKRVYVGDLYPGEKRAYSVRFKYLDRLQVDRVEVNPIVGEVSG